MIIDYKDKPKITDTIEFELLTPGADGCFVSNPYKVDNIKIFFVEKNFADGNLKEIDVSSGDATLDATALDAEQLACEDPTDENIIAAEHARAIASASLKIDPVFYTKATPVAIFGTPNFPAWLSTDIDNALIELIEEDSDGNPVFGRFKLVWMPAGGSKEGDYFVCWTWTPLIAGSSLSDNEHFVIDGDTAATTSIPSHQTNPAKYEMLLERFLPEIYKTTLADEDLTPSVMDKLNKAVAGGFTQIENLSNQIIDLYNANVAHESLLMLLSNMLGKKLRSEDPTLWRRQIVNAVPLYKRKGTYTGLKQALNEAGIDLTKITRLWQVVSKYTFQEAFVVSNEHIFTLAHTPVLPVDVNFKLFIRPFDSTEYIEIPIDNVEFSVVEGIGYMEWVGDLKSANPLSLEVGDELLVKYKIKNVPNGTQQTIEDFIITLPLGDQRDTRDQDFPLKNWNVRLIEEDNPMFDIVIPTKHPFHESVIFGLIRTEFPFGENTYNMEEYNGSTRESTEPCDIDKNFLDPCSDCLSSSISVDLDIEELSDVRISEAREVIEEYSPFHMNLFQLNIAGQVDEIIAPPIEEIEILITYIIDDIVLSGNANTFFTRVIEDGNTTNIITRSDLAEGEIVLSGLFGTAYNTEVVLYDALNSFQNLILSSHLFEVLSPSVNAGTYNITSFEKNICVVSGVSEPVDTSSFTYNLFNRVYTTTGANVTQDDLFVFSDVSIDFFTIGLMPNWKVLIPAYSLTPFLIEDILPDDTIILQDNGSLPNVDTSSISYTLLTDSDDEVLSSNNGVLDVSERGLVDVNDSNLETPTGDVQTILKIGDLIEISGIRYSISSFVDDQTFYIVDYAAGNAAGLNVPVYRTLVSAGTGVFDYRGIKLQTAGDHESELVILNGANAPTSEDDITESDSFKENYLVIINDTYYFKISEWDANIITLDGIKQDWTTLLAGGTSVGYALKHFTKKEISVNTSLVDPETHRFAFLDRRGNDTIDAILDGETTSFMALSDGSCVDNAVRQEENISFVINYKDGRVEERSL